MDESQDTPPLVAAPRHLRRRAFRQEIPDELLVPGVQPRRVPRADAPPAKRVAKSLNGKESDFRRKRLVALIAVVLVALSLPALVIALLLAG